MGVELVRLSGPVSVSQASAITLGDIKGYMTGKYDNGWWLGYVTQTDPSMQEVTVTFLRPHGPSRSFHYPSKHTRHFNISGLADIC